MPHSIQPPAKVSFQGLFHHKFAEPIREIHLRHTSEINSQPAIEEEFAFIYNRLISEEAELLAYRLQDEGKTMKEVIHSLMISLFC